MIGNDVVDLILAKAQSNWTRKGYLDKIFTVKEQSLIFKSENPEIMVWNLWSRKEAAYKIFNHQTGIRAYNPIQFESFDTDELVGKVIKNNVSFFTKTEINFDYIHTVAVLNVADFDTIKFLKRNNQIIKIDGIPCLIKDSKKEKNYISISNHGRFERIVSLF